MLTVLPSLGRGGAEEQTLVVARAAVRRGWTVSAAVRGPAADAGLGSDLAAAGVAVHALPDVDQASLRPLPATCRAGAGLARVLSRTRPDVVQLVLPAPHHQFAGVALCAALGVPTALVFHLVPRSFVDAGRRRAVYAFGRRRGQRWITVSDDNRRRLALAFGVPEHGVQRIHNGVRLPEQGDAGADRALVRDQLGLTASARVVLLVGRLSAHKGFEDALAAAPRLLAAADDLTFVIAGDGELREELEGRVRAAGTADRVRFLGDRRDVGRLMAMADLLLFPSRYEGLSLVLLEALAAGLPVVASGIASTVEVVRDGREALLFPSGDVDALAERTGWALAHPSQMATLAKAARRRVEAAFTERIMVDRHLQLLADLARGGR